MVRFGLLLICIALPGAAFAQPVPEFPSVEIPETAPPGIPTWLDIEAPSGLAAEEDRQSRFVPFALSASRFTPEAAVSNFGATPGGSRFDAVEIAPELRERTETILSELGTVQEGESLLITLPGDVLFDFDQHDVRADARPVLEQLAEALSALESVSIHIIGHTDAMGSDEYNQGLSERRAQSVSTYLVSLGIESAGMTIEGRGESEPVAANVLEDGSDNPQGRQLNRRVVFTIQNQEN